MKKSGGMKSGTGLVVVAGGLLLHVMLLLSVFDIYFRSPIVKNVISHQPTHEAPASRLVLFSVDGLRAESFLEHSHAPYLRLIAKERGLWGISNTRVPTESRPGHVAMIAGLYEDPSAVTRGWKKNPVNFDSVFNQSRYTWAWGADDILRIFTSDETENKIFPCSYNTEDQNFSSDKNTTLLDNWVFNEVKDFFSKARSNKALEEKLHSDKIIFFLHLLGMDTAGHTHKPNSPAFITNLNFVDNGIREMEHLFEEFYGNDKKTTYIMTSDHGMTDWGSHGAGDKHETETPYVVWGAGVAETLDPYETLDKQEEFGLPQARKKNITQADLAPLMSTFLSIPVPVNSVGKLPLELLSMSATDIVLAVHVNTLQLARQYDTLREQIEEHTLSWFYKPYTPFDKEMVDGLITYVNNLVHFGDYDKFISLCYDVMDLSIVGLSYYNNYHQNYLLTCASLSFLGWILLLLTILMAQRNYTKSSVVSVLSKDLKGDVQTSRINLIFGVFAAVIIFLLSVQKLPIQYYLYSMVPLLLWWRVIVTGRAWIHIFVDIIVQSGQFYLCFVVSCYVMGTVAMVWSFEERWWLSVPLVGMSLWPLCEDRKCLSWSLILCWAVSCSLLGYFSFLPVVGKETHIALVMAAGCIWLAVCVCQFLMVVRPLVRSGLESKREMKVIAGQAFVLCVALHNIYVQSRRFADGTPVVLAHQIVAWIIAGVCLVVPILSSTRQVCRLFSINTGLLTLHLLLSVSHEGLFLLTLVLNQVCWILIELRLSHPRKKKVTDFRFTHSEIEVEERQSLLSIERPLSGQDFRRAFFFLLYIILSFFGTGNIASINSFEVRWVTCFVTSFHPFVITGLILCKTLVPFLVVTCSFRAINIITKAPMGYLILVVLIFSDLMGVQFLHLVKNTGSWLQIGTSISQYVISQVITVFIVVLHAIAKLISEKSISHVVVKRGKKFV